MSAEQIKTWQRIAGVDADGVMGPETVRAIKSMQQRLGVEPDGVCGPKTWAAWWRSVGVDMAVNHTALTSWGERRREIRGIVIHHSDTATPARTVRALNAKCFSTHYEVDAAGRVVEYGDPLARVAWHAKVPNLTAIGIDLTHRGLREPFPAAQIEAAGRLLSALCHIHGLQPRISAARAWDGSEDHPLRTKAAEGERPKALWGDGAGVTLHRQWAATACPGPLPIDDLQAAVDGLPW